MISHSRTPPPPAPGETRLFCFGQKLRFGRSNLARQYNNIERAIYSRIAGSIFGPIAGHLAECRVSGWIKRCLDQRVLLLATLAFRARSFLARGAGNTGGVLCVLFVRLGCLRCYRANFEFDAALAAVRFRCDGVCVCVYGICSRSWVGFRGSIVCGVELKFGHIFIWCCWTVLLLLFDVETYFFKNKNLLTIWWNTRFLLQYRTMYFNEISRCWIFLST